MRIYLLYVVVNLRPALPRELEVAFHSPSPLPAVSHKHPPGPLTKTARYLYQAVALASFGIYLFKLYSVRYTNIKFVKYTEFLQTLSIF